MPKIGTGSARGDWSTIEEMLDDVMVRVSLFVTVYEALQLAGQRLDNKDGGAWVGKALQRAIDTYVMGQTPKGLYVVDSVRILGQIDAIRRAYGAAVHHIHLAATKEELRKRYESRSREDDEAVAKRNRTECHIEKFADVADIVVSTDRCSEEAVLARSWCVSAGRKMPFPALGSACC